MGDEDEVGLLVGTTLRNGYKLTKYLGSGRESEVYCGEREKPEPHKSAVKVCSFPRSDEDVRVRVLKECEILRQLEHPNIVTLYDAYEDEEDEKYYMFLELFDGGDLLGYLEEKKTLDEIEAKIFLYDIISAVDYIHRCGVVHRDLKLENILRSEKGRASLIDFSMGDVMGKSRTMSTFCGSQDYASPEMWMFKEYKGPEVDVWSLGVLLYRTVVGTFPFKSSRHAVLAQYELPENLSADFVDLIKRCLEPNGEARVKMPEILTHEWFCSDFGAREPVPSVSVKLNIEEMKRRRRSSSGKRHSLAGIPSELTKMLQEHGAIAEEETEEIEDEENELVDKEVQDITGQHTRSKSDGRFLALRKGVKSAMSRIGKMTENKRRLSVTSKRANKSNSHYISASRSLESTEVPRSPRTTHRRRATLSGTTANANLERNAPSTKRAPRESLKKGSLSAPTNKKSSNKTKPRKGHVASMPESAVLPLAEKVVPKSASFHTKPRVVAPVAVRPMKPNKWKIKVHLQDNRKARVPIDPNLSMSDLAAQLSLKYGIVKEFELTLEDGSSIPMDEIISDAIEESEMLQIKFIKKKKKGFLSRRKQSVA